MEENRKEILGDPRGGESCRIYITAIGSDSVVVEFFSVGIRLGLRLNSSEFDDIRVGSDQILSDSVEFRRNPTWIRSFSTGSTDRIRSPG